MVVRGEPFTQFQLRYWDRWTGEIRPDKGHIWNIINERIIEKEDISWNEVRIKIKYVIRNL